MGSPLDQPLAAVLGGRAAAPLRKAFELETVGDLLAHYPRRYARRGELSDLSRLPLGETVTIVGEVIGTQERPMRGKRGSLLVVTIGDATGSLALTFFDQSWRAKELHRGARGTFSGKVTEYRGARQLTHPDYELFEAEQLDPEAARAWAQQPIPIYPATASLPSWKIRRAIEHVLDAVPALEDPVPDALRTARGLVSFDEAVRLVHRPATDAEWSSAIEALRFHEAFVLQVALLRQRARLREAEAVSRVPEPGGLLERFDERLAFELTDDQRTVSEEIAADLAAPVPMNRLLQGEVGSGKTLVALRAMLAVADSGGQSALLAPTEVFAAQHVRSIAEALGHELAETVRPTLITGQLPVADRRRATLAAVSGTAHIVVGTHALLGDKTAFYDLGLVVVDEQHRFAVAQREALRLKAEKPPHVLVLTATPIPRTVAMTVFGDLDVSTIRTLPKGRQPIESFVVPLAEKPAWEARVWERLAEELAAGRQGFVVAPAIDAKGGDSELLEPVPDATGEGEAGDGENGTRPLRTVTETFELVRAHPSLKHARIDMLHGRMSSEEKDRIMRAFAAGEIDVLVATTVIEVGVDVPNASVMVVLDADRFGVSQLHQLRGRVGRGSEPGLALLVTTAEEGTLARERVDAVAATLDGFELARVDLELRREGDVLGSVQSGGRSSLRLLRVAKDGDLIVEARGLAEALLAEDPALVRHPVLADALERRLDVTERDFLAKN
ncbi:MAG TPA: ATP-dependent DNA helicase RecG [Terrimesophilobacter sp.]|nr:ATP-dependent DNA helicase RecG [Terrimesophilobacter sp.]